MLIISQSGGNKTVLFAVITLKFAHYDPSFSLNRIIVWLCSVQHRIVAIATILTRLIPTTNAPFVELRVLIAILIHHVSAANMKLSET